MRVEDFEHTPFGMIQKPGVVRTKREVDSTPPASAYNERYTRDRGWFGHLFDSKGKVL